MRHKTKQIERFALFVFLGLPHGDHDESKIRKAYFKMAQNYHPDKNPNGREMFEKVNAAYEFLCSKTTKLSDQPDPGNIVLILRAQSILFSRLATKLISSINILITMLTHVHRDQNCTGASR